MRIAVVGLGAIGAQTLWALSRRPGIEVHGFESGYIGHPFAGAGGEGRLFRKLELTTPGYLPVVSRADELWDALEQADGRQLRRKAGALLIGDAEDTQLVHALELARASGTEHEVYGAEELRKRYPQFSVADTELGIWDVDAGVIAPERGISAAVGQAVLAGAIVRDRTPVDRVDERADGVTLRLRTGEALEYDRVVVAGGGWTTQLVPELRDWIVTRRLTSVWYAGVEDDYLHGLPPFMRVAPSYCYGIPNSDERLVKLGLGFNDHLATGDPDRVPRHLGHEESREEIEKFQWILRDLLPGLDPNPVRFGTYIESYTRTMHEYLGLAPGRERTVVLGGFSGHGFKMAPALGEIGARIAVGDAPGLDIDFLRNAAPVFEITDPDTGATTHNSVVASGGD